jgi:hypothetical protein
MVVDEGHTPVAAHLLYADIIDETDLDQRERGLKMGIELLDACDAVWVFGDEMSPGMRAEINYARERNKPVSTRL